MEEVKSKKDNPIKESQFIELLKDFKMKIMFTLKKISERKPTVSSPDNIIRVNRILMRNSYKSIEIINKYIYIYENNGK